MKRIYSLDLLKILATICIVGFHYQGNMQYVNDRGINFAFGTNLYGNVVELFFIISGFFLAGSISQIKDSKITFGVFFAKKYARFFPLCFVAAFSYMIVELIRYGIMGSYLNDNISLWKTLLSAFVVNEGGIFPRSGVNGVTWYLSVLLICIAVFFFLTWLSTKLGVDENYLYLFMVCFGTTLFQLCSYEFSIPFLNYQVSRGYTCVFLGVLIRRVVYDNKYRMGRIYHFLMMSFGGAIFLLVLSGVTLFKVVKSDTLSDWWFIYVFWLFPLLVVLMLNTNIKDGFISRCRFLGVIGEISFDVFVWHMVILNIFNIFDYRSVLPYNAHSSYGFMVFLVVVWLFGALSHFLINKPLSKLFANLKNAHSIGDQL